jgi:hypothetical protein
MSLFIFLKVKRLIKKSSFQLASIVLYVTMNLVTDMISSLNRIKNDRNVITVRNIRIFPYYFLG